MKKNVILMFVPVLLMIVLMLFGYNFTNTTYRSSADKATIVNVSEIKAATTGKEDKWVRIDKTTKSAGKYTNAEPQAIIEYAQSLLGSPYLYTGITPAGFDCSGFVTYVFENYNLDIPHSSAMQANEGIPVTKAEAAPGDLVIFTGTNENDRTPGHVGIVISEPGDTISFVHSSSNGGVKISKVQGTRYDVRFLEVRRVL
jgi:cell wall-associated NlpC family hydrolase